MIEAIMVWNEPNNQAHWDFGVDPEWRRFAELVACSALEIRRANPRLKTVLGGISPVDPHFIRRLDSLGALDAIDVIALHGFPDMPWSDWSVEDWPIMLNSISAVSAKPIWVTEAGLTTLPCSAAPGESLLDAELKQKRVLSRTCELLAGRVPRVFWYTLYDLPKAWEETLPLGCEDRSPHKDHHFYMGLIDEDGRPKASFEEFCRRAGKIGICQWFIFQDPRLERAAECLKAMGVTHLRTGLSWADTIRDGWLEWFDHQMHVLRRFTLTLTLCFTPAGRGLTSHSSSPPLDPAEFARFCGFIAARYG